MEVEIFEKNFKFPHENLNGKLSFYPFSIPSFMTFVILYTSGKQHHFSGTIFSVSGGSLPPPRAPLPLPKVFLGCQYRISCYSSDSKHLAMESHPAILAIQKLLLPSITMQLNKCINTTLSGYIKIRRMLFALASLSG